MTSKTSEYTRLDKWRLTTSRGAYSWTYHGSSKEETDQAKSELREQSFAEKFLLGIPQETTALSSPETFADTARNGLKFFQQLQLDEGLWACDYGGPSFLLPGLVLALYITGNTIKPEWKAEITRYLINIVNPDGGWGLHIEDEKTNVFSTTLNYLVLRILGMSANHDVTEKARKKLHSLGGAIGNPQWGKHWLACLNLYEWNGVNPIPPDLWLLPEWMPAHPWRWWIHGRVVYLPTSYLYANRCQMPLNPLLEELRQEIYVEDYATIDFASSRNKIASTDINRKINPFIGVSNAVFNFWSIWLRPGWLHKEANRVTLDLMRREDENTSYNCLAPVNKAWHMVAEHFAGDSVSVAQHAERVLTYLWLGEKGMTAGGTNGVQVWDTAFASISIVQAGFGNDLEFRPMLEKALHFLDISQFRENLKDPYRQQRKGGWPFSTRDNGYIVSDCAAEGLKAVLLLQETCNLPRLLPQARLEDCIDTLLTMQNRDGGFSAYEAARGGLWMEQMNPSETFDNIMVEKSYPECTSAVVTALATFQKYYPNYRREDIEKSSSRAVKFLGNSQRSDGSWYGSWAVCFTYATFYVLEALESVGQIYSNSAIARKACEFLASKQKPDGGWGEHYTSCTEKEYIQHEKSQVVNTAWACLALMYARYPDTTKIRAGLELIKSRQVEDGSWQQEAVEGVFNKTCMIGYPNYRFYFSIWALGKWEIDYLPAMKAIKESEIRS